MSGAAAGVVIDRDVVRVYGNDAESYLQGQISQDVDSVAVGRSSWSLVLQPQGRIEAWFRLTRRQDDFLLDVDTGYGAGLVERLERFKLRVDAVVEILDGWRMLAVRGPKAGAVVMEAEVRAVVEWPGYTGIDFLGPDLTWPSGLIMATAADLEVLRIRAGWPAMGQEIGPRTIPAETPVIGCSVSFTKGCYTGQELVARIDSRGGNVPRPVRLIEIAVTESVEVGAVITVDGRAVGEVTSVAVDPRVGLSVALGAVHRRVEPPAAATVAGHEAVILAGPAVGAPRDRRPGESERLAGS